MESDLAKGYRGGAGRSRKVGVPESSLLEWFVLEWFDLRACY